MIMYKFFLIEGAQKVSVKRKNRKSVKPILPAPADCTAELGVFLPLLRKATDKLRPMPKNRTAQAVIIDTNHPRNIA